MPPEAFHEAMPFTTLLGAELLSAQPTEVRATLDWDPSRCTTDVFDDRGKRVARVTQTQAVLPATRA